MDKPFLNISEMEFRKGQRVGVLAPHPDDFDAISIALRILFEKGLDLRCHVLSSGASGVEDSFAKAAAIHDKGEIRKLEQIESIKLFGLPSRNIRFDWLTENDKGEIADTEDNFKAVKKILKDGAYEFIFIPHGNDTNPDHRLVFRAVAKSLKELKSGATLFLNRDPKTIAMRIDVIAPFDAKDAEWKGALLLCHQSQHARNLASRGIGFDQRILEDNRKYARELGSKSEFAEVFETFRY